MDSTSKDEQNLVIDNIEQINTYNYNQIAWLATSILSWFFFLCCQLENYRATKLILLYAKNENENFFILIIKIFIFGISLAGFITYLIFTTCNKNQNLYNAMLGKTKFHFIPLLFASALFIINMYEQQITEKNNRLMDNIVIKRLIITNLVFSILTLITLIIFYTKINIPCEWYIILTIKKGTFSCLIPYILHLICTDIFYLINFKDNDKIILLKKILSIIKGIISLFFSFIFKDIIVAFTNSFIYIKDLILYATILTNNKTKDNFYVFMLIVCASFPLLSIILILILLIKYKDKIFQ